MSAWLIGYDMISLRLQNPPSARYITSYSIDITYPDSKIRGANMGPIWDRKDPGWPHVGPTNFVIWVSI